MKPGWQKLQALALVFAFCVSMFTPGLAAATSHHGMDHHDTVASPGCQQRCNPTTPSATQTSEKDEQAEPDPKPAYQYPSPKNFTSLAEVKVLVTNPSEDCRLLRPPDKLVSACIFRF